MNWIYYHNLDPFVFRITDGFGLRWYGLSYLLGFLLGYVLLRWQIRRGWIQLSKGEALDLAFYGGLGGIIGGRLGYVFLYGLPFLLEDPLYLLKIWQGGMSIHGGILGAILGILIFARQVERSFWDLSDAAALCIPPGLFFGRLANFINGELWGRPTDGTWGVKFPQEIYSWGYVKLEKLRRILLAGELIEGEERFFSQEQLRTVVEQVQQHNQKFLDAVGPLLPARHPSQLYEAVLEGPVLLGILLWVRFRFDRRGIISGVFLIGYGVLRFLVEFTRAPDSHIGYEWLGMTRGQEYSLVFVGVGLVILAWFSMRESSISLD